MIEPIILSKNRPDFWWRSSIDGLYVVSELYVSKAIIVANRDIMAEIIIEHTLSGYKQNHVYYLSNSEHSAMKPESMENLISFLFESFPEYAEWFLFHPEWLIK